MIENLLAAARYFAVTLYSEVAKMTERLLTGARPRARGTGRLALIDALKALGSQFIVLHHLAFYGPMTDWTSQLMPRLMRWLSQDARMAVQVFLVVAGFLAVRSLAPRGVLVAPDPLALLKKRYVRTALPYLAALLLSMFCAELARHWMVHESIPDRPQWGQFIAHALLLHSVLDIDSISAGVWYVAIDFQLFALLLGLLWLARGLNGRMALGATFLVIGVALSLYGFNLDASWDAWALYFLGAYGLGALVSWATQPQRGLWGAFWLALLTLLVSGALLVEFRGRIALALAVAVLLGLAQLGEWLDSWPRSRVLAYFGQISYSVFLVNFPVALVVNALFTRYAPADVWVQTLGVVVAWLACNAVGALFYHGVELRLNRAGSARVVLPVDTPLTSSQRV